MSFTVYDIIIQCDFYLAPLQISYFIVLYLSIFNYRDNWSIYIVCHWRATTIFSPRYLYILPLSSYKYKLEFNLMLLLCRFNIQSIILPSNIVVLRIIMWKFLDLACFCSKLTKTCCQQIEKKIKTLETFESRN